MTIIRALWGDYFIHTNGSEIPKKQLFSEFNETVFVWGIENQGFLNSLGYKTILVSEKSDLYHKNTLEHKLDALSLGYENFGEVLFLDWDVKLLKPLDNNFISRLSSPTMTIYSYPIGYHEYTESYETEFIEQLKKYSWEWEDKLVLPNASFMYVNDFDLGKELKDIHKKNNFHTLLDEFGFFVYCNCSMEDYIKNFNSTSLFGRADTQMFHLNDEWVNTSSLLNSYVSSLIDMDVYFEHY